jgi:hypothetical protein
MSVSPCSPPRPALGQHSLYALRLSRRNPQGMGGLFETWKGCFDCDLTTHLTLTLDRQKRNCNNYVVRFFALYRSASCLSVIAAFQEPKRRLRAIFEMRQERK